MSIITKEFRDSALRRGIIVRSNKRGRVSTQVNYAAVIELANLGFIVDPDELAKMGIKEIEETIFVARKIMGADRDMTPIYPGFPKQVEELDTTTLLVEQILHYWTNGAFLPNYPTIIREGLPLEDMLKSARDVKVLPAAATARELIKKLTTSPIALSDDDKSLLDGCVKLQLPTLEELTSITKEARNGENLQSLVRVVKDFYTVDELIASIAPSCANSDQLLRLVLAIATKPSGEYDKLKYDLAVNNLSDKAARYVRMSKISRPSRRIIVERLGVLTKDFDADKLVSRQYLWRKVMRTVHPYDFKLSLAQKRAVDVIHSNIEYRTFNSLVEEAMEKKEVKRAVELLGENQPGNLLRRVVALLRLTTNLDEANILAKSVREIGVNSTLTTLISAYNGVISANDKHTRVTRVAGLNNTMVDRKDTVDVNQDYVDLVALAIKDAIREVLKTKKAPEGMVKVKSDIPMPLVRRDAATTDRTIDRGEEFGLVGEGNILRMFGHWNNNQNCSGYMDIGIVILDEKFNHLGISTWDTWNRARDWSTYSGDKLVEPGDSAAEFIDVKLDKVKKRYPKAEWAVMTVQSWSGFPMNDVDFIAGAMLRSNGNKGAVFDARTVSTAFKPTTECLQSVPFAVNLNTRKLIWVDSSNGSMKSNVSSSHDPTIGSIVYDEIVRTKLTKGELAVLWAEAHDAETIDEKVDSEELMSLLE